MNMAPFMKIDTYPQGKITAPFGSIDSVHSTPHSGVDISLPIGTELHSPVDGIVSKIVDYGDKNIGKGIFIKTDTGYQFIFGHLSEYKCSQGQIVNHGDLIALSGNSGHSTGAHLHYGLLDKAGNFIDPLQYPIYKLKEQLVQLDAVPDGIKNVLKSTVKIISSAIGN